MTAKCKFKEPWRAYKKGDVADLKPERSDELARLGVVEVLERAVPAESGAEEEGVEYDQAEAIGALNRTIAELRQKLAAAENQCREWKAKYERADETRQRLAERATVSDSPAENAASDAQPDAEAPQAAEGPAEGAAEPDPASLFTELSLPEGVKRKLAAAGFRTTEDVKKGAAAEGGLAAVRGVSKVVAQQVTEELAKLPS